MLGTPYGTRQDLKSALYGAFASDAGLYTISEGDPTAILERHDRQSGAVSSVFEGHALARGAVGHDVAIANTEDGEMIPLDPDTLRPLGERLPDARGAVEVMSLSADDRRLLVLGADRDLRLYDVGARLELGTTIAVDRVAGAAIRPDGQQAAVATRNGIVLWDLDPRRWVEGACFVAGRYLTRTEWATYVGDLAPYRATCPQFPAAE